MNEPVLQRERGGRLQAVKGTVRLREANANQGGLKAERRPLFYRLRDFALICMWKKNKTKKAEGRKGSMESSEVELLRGEKVGHTSCLRKRVSTSRACAVRQEASTLSSVATATRLA